MPLHSENIIHDFRLTTTNKPARTCGHHPRGAVADLTLSQIDDFISPVINVAHILLSVVRSRTLFCILIDLFSSLFASYSNVRYIIVLKSATEIKFLRQLKEMIKHYNIVRRY